MPRVHLGQVRGGTTAQWTAANPVILAAREIGYDTTLNLLKVGDGATAWANLVGFTQEAAADIRYTNIIVVPASAMSIVVGVPSIAIVDSVQPVYLLDAAATETVGGGVVRVPQGWTTAAIKLLWANAATSAGNVVLRADRAIPIAGSAYARVVGTPVTLAANGTISVPTFSTIETGIAVTPGGYLSTAITRVGGDAADTLVNDIQILAIVLEKAS